MKVALTGINGFIGSNLKKYLVRNEIEIIGITHSDFSDKAVLVSKLADVIGIINLAGFPVYKRWTRKNKKRILESRIISTADLIKYSPNKLSFFINASGIDVYNDIEKHSESSNELNNNFIGKVVQNWETEVDKVHFKCNRIIKARFGVIIDKNSLAWQRLSFSYKFKFGIIPTDKKNHFSFMHIKDLCRAILFIIKNNECNGIYNFVAPENLTYGELGHLLKRKYNSLLSIRIPNILIKLFMGKGGIALLRSKDIVPERLLSQGFVFKYRNFAEILQTL